MRKILATAFFGLAVAAVAHAQVTAPCEAYWNADVVFVGRVEGLKRSGAARVASFAVVEGFRGVASSSIDVATTAVGEECKTLFRIGREYLVYAGRHKETASTSAGVLTNRCAGTREVVDAGADLAYARDVKQGTAPPGYVGGDVVVGSRTLGGTSLGVAGLAPDVTVNVSYDGATDAIIAEGGRFRVASRGAGTYRVSVNVPDHFYSDNPERVVTLSDPRSCAAAGFTVYDDGRVTGRVVDAAGRPIAGLTIELGATGVAQGRRTVTNRDGQYSLPRLPRGRFVLSVPIGQSRAAGARQPRVFYPGVDTLAAAARLAIGPGERVTMADFRMPAQHKYVAISGTVFDADGTPAEGARVYLKGVGEDDRILSEPVIVDFVGRFVIAARAGGEYLLFAERPRPGERAGRVDSTDQVRLTAVDGLTPARLALQRRY